MLARLSALAPLPRALSHRLVSWWHDRRSTEAPAWLADWTERATRRFRPEPQAQSTADSLIAAATAAAIRAAPQKLEGWPAERVQTIQRLFGEGFTVPGGVEGAREVVKPLALTAANSVLDMSGALGGMARLIAREFGAWVTAIEEDVALAEAGLALSTKAGLAKKAAVVHAKLTEVPVRARSQDAVVAQERFHLVEDKPALLATISSVLKPGGQLAFTEYCSVEGADPAAAAAWSAAFGAPMFLTTIDGWRAHLAGASFQVRVAQDITREHCARLVADFARLVESVKGAPLNKQAKAWIVREAAIWLRLASALDAGSVKLYRLHAKLPH